MKSVWKVDEELMKSLCRADEELVTDWFYSIALNTQSYPSIPDSTNYKSTASGAKKHR